MKNRKLEITSAMIVAGLVGFIVAPSAQAHCDGLDGPVVKAAQRALVEANLKLVLPWVREADEAELRRAFERTLLVRKLGQEAKELADRYFFETVVRVHRAGEGAPYTGLKPAGYDYGPAIRAGDKALETGKLQPASELLAHKVQDQLRINFEKALAAKKFNPNDVEAGRRFVKAYVEYIHYVEAVHELGGGKSAEDSHGQEHAHESR